MEGTNITEVMRYRSMVWRTFVASKRGRTTTDPPLTRTGTTSDVLRG